MAEYWFWVFSFSFPGISGILLSSSSLLLKRKGKRLRGVTLRKKNVGLWVQSSESGLSGLSWLAKVHRGRGMSLTARKGHRWGQSAWSKRYLSVLSAIYTKELARALLDFFLVFSSLDTRPGVLRVGFLLGEGRGQGSL